MCAPFARSSGAYLPSGVLAGTVSLSWPGLQLQEVQQVLTEVGQVLFDRRARGRAVAAA